eukprot:10739163-Lingulodinium_polyedra.AAC.1
MGQGLEAGPPHFGPALKARQWMAKRGLRRRVAALEALVCGGANRMCPRCGGGCSAVETPWHRYF